MAVFSVSGIDGGGSGGGIIGGNNDGKALGGWDNDDNSFGEKNYCIKHEANEILGTHSLS